ncbi:MAG TPA: molecular chaperone TorD family protein [Chitinophagales bacterium]|nr:molecular chaperone TorD family protein [Chitinophagales bacterium]
METNDKLDYLLRADLYRLLSRGFSYPEKNELAEISETAKELLENSLTSDEIKNHLRLIAGCIREDELLNEYTRLFLKGNVPQTETAVNPSYEALGNLAAFYKAFGFTPNSGNSPDSLSYELEFVSLLCLKVALAENHEQRKVTLDALQKFLSEHVKEFSTRFHQRLHDVNAHPFYLYLAHLLESVAGFKEKGKKKSLVKTIA